jgi:RNA polymerase sigma-70 factor (ECF subfamily)
MHTEGTDAILHQSLREALEGSELKAWEDFVREAHGVVASTVLRALSRWRYPQKDQVEDLVQETFLKLCANDFYLLRRFRSDRSEALVAYLRAVTSTVVSDAQRARSAQKRGSGGEALDLDDVPHAAATTQSIEQVERDMLFSRVAECLSDQRKRDRQIFWLYYRHGLTTQAIAEIKVVELSSSGVESLIRRLTIAVRKCLKIRGAETISQTAKGNIA